MASLLRTVLTAEPNNTASANVVLCSEVKIEVCMLLAELSELTPDEPCEPFKRFKGLLCNLCDYCADVIASGGIPCFAFHFQFVDMKDSELKQIGAAMKAKWQSVPETKMHLRFHMYRCLDVGTDLCFQVGSRLIWDVAEKVGIQFQRAITQVAAKETIVVVEPDH